MCVEGESQFFSSHFGRVAVGVLLSSVRRENSLSPSVELCLYLPKSLFQLNKTFRI